MAVEGLFDIVWIDVEAAANNEVFLALDNIEVAIFVKASHIACIQPAIAQGGLGGTGHVVIAFHDVGATRDDLAHLANGNRPVVLIHNLDLHICDGFANRTGLTRHIKGMPGEYRAGLRESIAFEYLAVKFLLETFQNREG